jgi:hypothetical protein
MKPRKSISFNPKSVNADFFFQFYATSVTYALLLWVNDTYETHLELQLKGKNSLQTTLCLCSSDKMPTGVRSWEIYLFEKKPKLSTIGTYRVNDQNFKTLIRYWYLVLQVSIRQSGWEFRHFCGGSIIDEVHVLTAAHCLYGWGTDNSKVRVTYKPEVHKFAC